MKPVCVTCQWFSLLDHTLTLVQPFIHPLSVWLNAPDLTATFYTCDRIYPGFKRGLVETTGVRGEGGGGGGGGHEGFFYSSIRTVVTILHNDELFLITMEYFYSKLEVS